MMRDWSGAADRSSRTGNGSPPAHPESDTPFCADLSTTPRELPGGVLVTGASGYIGGRLVPELLERGYSVRTMVRGGAADVKRRWPGADVAVADALDLGSLGPALEGIDTAYYLIHSMLLGPGEFAGADAQAASNFAAVAGEKGVRRIIYLGGLGDLHSDLSRHLRSRMEVARRLEAGPVPVTILRAAIIIGSGSASYEILSSLVDRFPVLLTPREIRSLCQPVSIRDVVKYLVGSLESEETSGGRFDIGGDEVMSYREMMKTVAGILDRKRLFITMPFVSLRVFGYIAGLVTPVPAPITMSLMEGLKNDVICEDSSIRRIIPFTPLPYRTALVRAMSREEQDRVHTRWSDAYPPASELAIRLGEVEGRPMYRASSSIGSSKEAAALFESICRIGGREGWFHGNWMWRLRGAFDRVIMGVGTRRGRKSSSGLGAGDVVDFWRVEDIIPSKRLLLRAEMKLPGKAWLEFHIGDHGDRRELSLTARYLTTTLFGRAYWYFFLPFHRFIFRGLLRQIEERSG
jgi:uncharacterized protein YbjT (DUF2867 family)